MTMHKLREYMTAIEGDTAKKEEVYEKLWWGLSKLKMHDEDDFNKMMMKVHCVVYGPHFDRHLAEKVVSKMHNVDGTKGEHWSYDQVSNLAAQYNVKEVADYYYALNMLYSDLSAVMGSDAGTYVKLAKALYYDDPDMMEGKLFKQWVAVSQNYN